jgi:hypothetical protein
MLRQAEYKGPHGPSFTISFIIYFPSLLTLTNHCGVTHSQWCPYTNSIVVMAPGLLSDPMTSVRRSSHSVQRSKIATTIKNCLLNRSVNHTPLRVSRGVRNSYVLEDGTEIYDAAGGAAVACIGKRNKRVEKAMGKVQKSGLSYIPSLSFDTMITANLADWMIRSTDGKMRKAVLYGSGTKDQHAHMLLS